MAKKQTAAPAINHVTNSETKLDMKVVMWIKEHLNATHNDLPIEYVREWSRRVVYNQTVYCYVIFGNQQQQHDDVCGENTKEYIEEFEAKLSLRLYQDYIGITLPGLPMFRIIGKDKMAEHLRGQRSLKVLNFPK